ncbi:hypothetical protein EVAR_100092_1 [Eumeta japonica]|uniref:Uncharacterized protein n=1 Tax=Eumeta variegata TaxID=151549 RepID=A0A4C1Z0T9_EUMVA|nr:hypothetical protein EVAR_100092_1 [Eumeta japonica]
MEPLWSDFIRNWQFNILTGVRSERFQFGLKVTGLFTGGQISDIRYHISLPSEAKVSLTLRPDAQSSRVTSLSPILVAQISRSTYEGRNKRTLAWQHSSRRIATDGGGHREWPGVSPIVVEIYGPRHKSGGGCPRTDIVTRLTPTYVGGNGGRINYTDAMFIGKS